jgi:Zn-dependent membrane protease YugP
VAASRATKALCNPQVKGSIASPERGYFLYWASTLKRKQVRKMNILLIIVAIIAIILLFTGGFVSALNWLIWVGIILLVFAIIVWLVRLISGRRSV